MTYVSSAWQKPAPRFALPSLGRFCTVAVMLVVALAPLACREPQSGATRHFVKVPAEAGTAVVPVNCDPNAAIDEQADGGCACLPGFTGDGVTCTDVDECADPKLNDCDPNAACTNRPGGFSCKCKDGFVGDGTACTNTNACTGAQDTCDPNATCSTGDAGTSCQCKPGFTGDGNSCTDVDECKDPKLFTCANNAVCQNTFGGYTCACAPGFTGDGNVACRSLCDGVSSTVCATQGLCRVEGQAPVCDACSPGFTGSGATCTASTTCQAACDGVGTDDAPNSVCNADGSCACAPGYSGSPGSCVDVDECKEMTASCGDNTDCTNLPGGYACSCKQGYALDATGKCANVNECAATPGPCHPDATCTDTSPGFTCACKAGFSGDGFTCKDVNECATNNGGCASTATCLNQRGTSTCQCTPPLIGDPSDCHCDLSGIWGVREDVSTCWADVPIMQGADQDLISSGSIEATTWELHEFTYDGNQLEVDKKGCGSDKTPDLVSPLFRETYSSYIPTSEYDTAAIAKGKPFAAPGLIPGSSFSTPTEAAVLGIDLGSDPVNAPWPAKEEDVMPSQWVDADNDGEPGLTLWPRLPSQTTQSGAGHYSYLPARPGSIGGSTLTIDQRAGCVSVAVRLIGHLEEQVDTCSHLIGTVITDKTEGRVHSCTLVDKGTCDPDSPNSCTGWSKDITCNTADWAAADTAARCTSADLDRLDNDQNQKENTTSTFEMVKLGSLEQSLGCPDVRAALPAIMRSSPRITCTTPQ